MQLKNFSATAAFQLTQGGRFLVTLHATWSGGNVILERLAADGTTYVQVPVPYQQTGTAGTATFPTSKLTADGSFLADLPAGDYQFAVTTATGVYAEVALCYHG